MNRCDGARRRVRLRGLASPGHRSALRAWVLALWGAWGGIVPAGAQSPSSEAVTGGSGSASAPASSSLWNAWGWEVPPVVYGGALGMGLNMNRDGAGGVNHAQFVNLSLNWSSYIYAPWLLTVGGQNEWAFQRQSLSGQGSGNTAYLTGVFRLNFFPRSDFPVDLSFRVSDSRTGGVNPPSVAPAQGTDLQANYARRTPGTPDVYNLRLSRQSLKSRNAVQTATERVTSGDKDSSTSVSGDFSTLWKFNTLSLTGSYNRTRRGNYSEREGLPSGLRTRSEQHARSEYLSGTVAHQYRHEDKPYSLDTLFNFNYQRDEAQAGLRPWSRETEVGHVQTSSAWVYVPETEGLTLDGSVSGLFLENMRLHQRLISLSSQVQSSYKLSEAWRVQGGVNLGWTGQKNGKGSGVGVDQQVMLGTSANLNWAGRQWDAWGGRYQIVGGTGATLQLTRFWAGGRVSCASLDACPLSSMVQGVASAQMGQVFTRAWDVSPESTLQFQASQTLQGQGSWTQERRRLGQIQRQDRGLNLTHAASINWSRVRENQSATAFLNFNDTRALQGEGGQYTLWVAQVQGEWNLTRKGHITASLGWQLARSQSGGPLDILRVSSRSVVGELSYRVDGLFNVPRLRFESRLRLTQDPREAGGGPGIERTGRVLENNLYWNMGRLEAKIGYHYIHIQGSSRHQFNANVARAFGD